MAGSFSVTCKKINMFRIFSVKIYLSPVRIVSCGMYDNKRRVSLQIKVCYFLRTFLTSYF